MIDAHTHVGGPDRYDYARQAPAELVEMMDNLGVAKAVVLPFNITDPGICYALANSDTARAVQEYPDRFLGYALIDPNCGDAAVRELERAVTELDLGGVKLLAADRRFSLSSPLVKELVVKAAALGVPVVVDMGRTLSLPRTVGHLATQVPEATIIVEHVAGPTFLEPFERQGNLYLGTTGMFGIPKLRDAYQRLGADRLIAGSD
jgi:predicted TIM-barrel fold metal-dependent hydrolase